MFTVKTEVNETNDAGVLIDHRSELRNVATKDEAKKALSNQADVLSRSLGGVLAIPPQGTEKS